MSVAGRVMKRMLVTDGTADLARVAVVLAEIDDAVMAGRSCGGWLVARCSRREEG